MATIRELRAQASELSIKGYSRMTKDQLESAIANASNSTSAKANPEILISSVGDQNRFYGKIGENEIVVNKDDDPQIIASIYKMLGKSNARKLRIMLYKHGFRHLAQLRRAA